MIPRLYEAKENNFDHNGLGLLVDTISCQVTEEQNGLYELELTYKVGSFLCSYLVEDNIIKTKANEEHDPQLFRIYYVSEEHEGTIQIRAEHISYDLRGNFLENIFLSNVTCQQAGTEAFNKLEESHNFTFYSDIEHTANYNISRANGLECVAGKRGSLLDTFGNGAKLVRDNFKISLVKNRGKNNNVLISYKKNMTGYKRELDLTDIATKIYPFAIVEKEVGTEDNPQTIEELIVLPERFLTSPNYDKYANGKILAVDYSEQEGVNTIEKLRNASSKFFIETDKDEPNINYQVEFIDLSKTTEYKNLGLEQLEKVCLDDIVIINDSRFNRKVEARVIKTVYNSLTERYETIELGKFKDSLKVTDTDLNEKVENSLNSIKNMLVRFEVLDDKVISEVSRLEGDVKTNTSLIEQTADSISQVVKDVEGNTSLINQTVDSINQVVKDVEGNTSLINQTSNSLTSKITGLDGKYTELKQTVDGLDLTGVVTFNDLKGNGTTVINGANITTGSISGDKIESNSITSSHISTSSITSSHISSGSITVDKIASNNSDPIITLFNNCAIDATYNNNKGKGTSIRLKWDNNDYLKIGSDIFDIYTVSGGTSPTFRFYGGPSTQTIKTQSGTITINSSGLKWNNTNLSLEGHTHSQYSPTSHNHNGGYISPYNVTCGTFGDGGTTLMHNSLDGNNKNLGYSGSKFNQVSAKAVWGDTGSWSDARTKENIRYLDTDTLNLDEDNNTSTKAELFNFINNIKLCEYNYKEEFRFNDNTNNKIGFVADDVLGDKVGNKIVAEHEGYLTYNLNNMLFATIGALQEEIRIREEENNKLKDRLNNIEKILGINS